MNSNNTNEITPTNTHPMLLYSGSGTQLFAEQVAKHLGTQLAPSDSTPHANGEAMVKVLDKDKFNVRSRDVFVIQSLSRQWNLRNQQHTGVNDMIMELFIWGNLLRLASAHNIIAVIPHFAYARQDRKDASRTPITARLMADLIQTAGFNRVLTMDLHAPQIQGFFDPTKCVLDHLNAGSLITDYFNSLELKNPVILCPDIGNVKKADKYKSVLPSEVEMAIIEKRRDSVTGKVTAVRLVGDVKDRDVFITDDIISTAGTMREAIELADKLGARSFYLAATHGEFVGNAVENLQHPKVKEIAVTDTVFVPECLKSKLPLKVLSATGLFAEAINRIHKGESLSELLGVFG